MHVVETALAAATDDDDDAVVVFLRSTSLFAVTTLSSGEKNWDNILNVLLAFDSHWSF